MKFSRLVSYGCSHTAGAETQDEDYVPGADKIKKEIGYMKFMLEYDPIFSKNKEEYINAGKKKSYIKHLADHLQLPYDNRAVSGSGLPEQIYQIESDLASGNIKETDLIIIGITGKDRILKFEGDQAGTILLAYEDTYPENLRNSHKQFIEYYSDKIVTFQSLIHYQYLLNLVNTILQNQLYFVFCDTWAMMLDYNFEGIEELSDSFKFVMRRLHNDFRHSKYLLSNVNLYHDSISDRVHDRNNNPNLHGGNHVKEIIHKKFADTIYKKISELGIIF